MSCGKSFSSTTDHESMTRKHMTKQSVTWRTTAAAGARNFRLVSRLVLLLVVEAVVALCLAEKLESGRHNVVEHMHSASCRRR